MYTVTVENTNTHTNRQSLPSNACMSSLFSEPLSMPLRLLIPKTESKSSIDNDMVSVKINECVVLELS